MKHVQVVLNIQVPDHISEQEVSVRLNQVISSLLTEEFGLEHTEKDPTISSFDCPDGQIGHA
ncbi:MAG: hypothetical protein GKS05_07130 [Nitrospirales bacterium]|nr:hypothetical protein [Nitrospirales bacterium]